MKYKLQQLLKFMVLPVLLYACSGNGKSNATDSGNTLNIPEPPFPIIDTLYGEFLPEGMEQGGWMRIQYTPYGILCENNKPGRSGCILQLIDTLSGKIITKGVRQGRGPGELIQWYGLDYDYRTNTYYTDHNPKKELARFAVTKDSIYPLPFFKTPDYIYKAVALTDTTYCMTNFFPNQSVFINNNTGKVLFKMPNMPLNDKRINYHNNLINKYFNSRMQANRKRTKVVMTDGEFSKIRIYRVQNNTLELEKDTMYLAAKYKVSEQGWPLKIRDNIITGNLLWVTDQYIYIHADFKRSGYFYFDNPIQYDETPSYLLIFDWDLKYYGCYRLDRDLYSFTVSPDDKSLYGYTFDDKENSRLIKYKLNTPREQKLKPE